MSAITQKLLPLTSETDAGGRIKVGGCDLLDLAAEFGTPLFVYDEEHIVQRCRQVVDGCSGQAVYATKAFLCRALVELIAGTGLGFDFSSAGELEVVLAGGADPAKTVFHGSNKKMSELQRALDVGAGRIVVDSDNELDRLETIYKASRRRAQILLRITPGMEVYTHEYVATGVDDTQFGFTVSSGLAEAAINRARKSPAVELLGLHAHIGSQILNTAFFQRAVAEIIGFAKPYGLAELSIGGGLGIAYTAKDTAPEPADWLAAINSTARSAAFTAPISVEPGRSIVGGACITLYEIGTIKPLKGLRTYVSVDGGMSDNIRPALYGSDYEAFLPRAAADPRSQAVRVVGHHCETGDIVVRNGFLPSDTAVGDILAVPVTGAYGYAMSSNYNRTPRPAVVFVRAGRARLVIRRETLADFDRLEAV